MKLNQISYWRQQKQLLTNRSFQFYLYSSIAGTFASGLVYIVIIWMILQFNQSVNATLFGMILFWLPSLLLSPHLGALVDHYDRKKLIIAAELVRAVMFTGFGFLLLYEPNLWSIYLMLVLGGCFAALYKPLLPAFVHELVPEEQLVYANANINMAYELGNIIGRGILTVAVLTFIGTYEALFIVAALYVISAATMIPVKRYHIQEYTPKREKLAFFKSISDGYRYLFSNKRLFLYALVQAFVVMSLMAAPVLVGPYVKTILHAGSRIFGISEAVISIGAILGAFFWSYLANYLSEESCLAIASVLAGLSYITLGTTAGLHYALIAFLVLGFSWGSFALIMSTVQTLTDKNYQGRVQAAIGAAVTLVFIGFSIFLAGFDRGYSAQHAFMLLTLVCVAVFVGVLSAKRLK